MEAIVFAGVNALDSEDFRQAVLRIPQVTMRIKQAQKILDENTNLQVELSSHLSAGEEFFVSSLSARSLITAIVQIGLFERFLRYHSEPAIYIGSSNGDSALKYVCQKSSFEELVLNSQLVGGPTDQDSNVSSVETQLAGAALVEYTALESQFDGKFKSLGFNDMDLGRLVRDLTEERGIKSLVNVGPGGPLMTPVLQGQLNEVRVLESLELDPMLSSVITPYDRVAWM